MFFYFSSDPIPIQKKKEFLKEELNEAKKKTFNKEADALFASISASEQEELVKSIKKKIPDTTTKSKHTTESRLTKEIKHANLVVHKDAIEIAELNARISKNKEKKAIQLWKEAKIHAQYIECLYSSCK
jgi:hypothetical protein